ncbi:MAG: hypothetical protein H0X37_19070 [Herpetosiphonaceae bacterium]|nr:hypothetical protein [Herpetosiphonaceae bacterium]
MARGLGMLIGGLLALVGLGSWYRRESLAEANATVHLQSEHEHFHLHVDLPPQLEIQPGDTLQILSMPTVAAGQTNGELTYGSRVRLSKASWLKRNLIKHSSFIEINELVEHP